MAGQRWRRTVAVEVPNVVGMRLSDARRVAHSAGVVLAQPDSDGPPLAALTWPLEYIATSQDPHPGARLWRWDSVVVSWRALDRGDPARVREPRRPLPGPGDVAMALPEPLDTTTSEITGAQVTVSVMRSVFQLHRCSDPPEPSAVGRTPASVGGRT